MPVITLLLIETVLSNVVLAQDSQHFPVPDGNPNQLFYLQRTPNTNTIVYELNYKDGFLDSVNPVHVFWIRYAEKSQRAELNYIQRNFAYGLRARLLSPDNFELKFVSDKNAVMYLRKTEDNKYHVYTIINNKEAILSSVWLQIDGGYFFSPNIKYAELKGVDTSTGLAVYEKVKIKKQAAH